MYQPLKRLESLGYIGLIYMRPRGGRCKGVDWSVAQGRVVSNGYYNIRANLFICCSHKKKTDALGYLLTLLDLDLNFFCL